MRVLIQRVKKANVLINELERRIISAGMVVFVGIEEEDNEIDAQWISNKIVSLRIFNDAEGVMNLDINQVEGKIMLISQFTLHASTKKGNRPSYIKAAKPEKSMPLYLHLAELLKNQCKQSVVLGKFGAHMDVELVNDGPVTIWMDSKNKE